MIEATFERKQSLHMHEIMHAKHCFITHMFYQDNCYGRNKYI